MKKLEQKFKDISQNTRLSDAEKNSMRAYLLEYQAMKPVRNTVPQYAPFSFLSFKSVPVFVAVIILFGGGAGASVAAQDALPGDILYPVKVSVNEKVVGAFAISDDAKAAHETALAGARLSEAEALSEKNDLSTSTSASLEAGFTAHADNARAHIARLQTTDSVRADVELSSFAAVLSTHAHTLAHTRVNEHKRKLISAIRSQAVVAVDLADTLEADTSVGVAVRTAAKTAAPVQLSGKGKRVSTGVRAVLQSIVDTTEENNY